MPLAPYAEGPYIDERHLRVAVIACRHGSQEVVQLLQEDGVVVVRLPEGTVLVELTGSEVVALRASLLYPFRRRVAHPRLRA